MAQATATRASAGRSNAAGSPKAKATESMGRKPKEPNDDTYRGRFGANLRAARAKRFDSQQEFADRLAENGLTVTKQSVSSWETGFRLPTIDTLPIIAETLGVSIRSLIPPN